MSEGISDAALARKKRFLEAKGDAGSFEQLVEKTERANWYLYFDERGDIVSLCHDAPSEVNPLWLTYAFDQHELAMLKDKDTNQFWVVTDSKGVSKIRLRPQATVYAAMDTDDVTLIDFGEGDADLSVSIKEESAVVKLSSEVKEKFKGVYPIQATVKGKRIFKLFVADPDNQNIIYDTITVSMVELLTEEEINKDLIADLRHCHVYTAPLFDKYLRV
jgi:hypothetical protein